MQTRTKCVDSELLHLENLTTYCALFFPFVPSSPHPLSRRPSSQKAPIHGPSNSFLFGRGNTTFKGRGVGFQASEAAQTQEKGNLQISLKMERKIDQKDSGSEVLLLALAADVSWFLLVFPIVRNHAISCEIMLFQAESCNFGSWSCLDFLPTLVEFPKEERVRFLFVLPPFH